MAPRNLNDPANWLPWLRACAREPGSPIRLEGGPRPFAALTGQDTRALGAIAACWHLYASSDHDGARGAIDAIAALLPAVQPQCRYFARELVAQTLDWPLREPLYQRALAAMAATPLCSQCGSTRVTPAERQPPGTWSCANCGALWQRRGERDDDAAIAEHNQRALDSLGAFTGAARKFLGGLGAEAARSRAVREDLALAVDGPGDYFCPVCARRWPLLVPCKHIEITPAALAVLRERFAERQT